MKIFLATTNSAKIERYKNLLKQTGLEVEVFTPKDFGLENVKVEETGKTLLENAKLKALAFKDKVKMPILSNDTGFWVEGEGFVLAPKRTALAGESIEKKSKEEIAKFIIEFWQNLANEHGGKVDAAWLESFVGVGVDGKVYNTDSKREMILTNEVVGQPSLDMPIRALCISKATTKYSLLHTQEEELLEMQPLIQALKKLLEKLKLNTTF
jgi:hypothetical protein